jgi:hypothetical protein
MTKENSIQKDISILELMTLKITKYFNKSIYISDLIYDLESYLNQLTVVDKEWKKNFRTTWLDIEVAYSLALDQGSDKPINDGDAIVVNSLNTLNKMAKDKIENLKNDL